MQTHANTGGDAYETPQCGRIKDATKAKSERFPLYMLMLMLRERGKGAPA